MLNLTDNSLVYESGMSALSHGCMCFCTLGTATFSDGLHRRVPAVASSPRASEHIRTHGLFIGQKPSQQSLFFFFLFLVQNSLPSVLCNTFIYYR